MTTSNEPGVSWNERHSTSPAFLTEGRHSANPVLPGKTTLNNLDSPQLNAYQTDFQRDRHF